MNRSQVAFVASFFSTSIILFTLSQWVQKRLADAGYHISDIILYGLNTTEYNRAEEVTGESTLGLMDDLKHILTPQAFALTLAVITTVFLYVKVAHRRRKPVLNPQAWQEFPLKEKIVISPNTAIYRFALPHPQDVLGLPIGQHISVSAEINGKDIMRSYTPTSSDDDLGHFDLLIKSYEKGNISRMFSLLKLGDKVRIKGPKGQFNYSPTLATSIGMIAGGTGITPMLQIIRASLKNPMDKTKLSLIYANVNFEDILLKKELDELVDVNPDRFTVYYVLNNAPEGWKGGVGFVSKEQIQTYLPPTADDVKILMCGPPPMMNAMKKHLEELKYPAPRTVSKLVDQVFLF
ncbi:NADH-cytochrome b5 reductase [Pleurotus pulmonarius]|nr:NADH-cytochrome b5 reductase [Pleurotus pulmonarius]